MSNHAGLSYVPGQAALPARPRAPGTVAGVILSYGRILDAAHSDLTRELTGVLNRVSPGPVCILGGDTHREEIRAVLAAACDEYGYELVTLAADTLDAASLRTALAEIARAHPALLLVELADTLRPERALPTGESLRIALERLCTSGVVARAVVTLT